MAILINPRKRKKRTTKKRIIKKRRVVKRKVKRNPFLDPKRFGKSSRGKGKKRTKEASMPRKRRRKKTVKKTVRRRKAKVSRRRKRTLPVFASFKRRRKRRNPTPKYYVGAKTTKRRGRRRARTQIAVRRYKRRAVMNVYRNPDIGTTFKRALMFGVGLVGNKVVSNLLSNVLGGTVPFLQGQIGKLVSSGAVSALAWFLLGKKQPEIVTGSALATMLEGVKLVLPQSIKDMLGLGYLADDELYPYNQAFQGIPYSEVQGIPESEVEGFAPDYESISGFAPDYEQISEGFVAPISEVEDFEVY